MRTAFETTVEFVVFVGGLAGLFVLLWLLAPAGAAYPR